MPMHPPADDGEPAHEDTGAPTALITGAAGFVGQHLVTELERETDWQLLGLRRRAGPEQLGTRTRLLSCDLLDRELVLRVLARHRPAYIFHLAAQSYVPQAFAAPSETLTNNLLGQLNLLEACRVLEIDALIVVACSAEEYGFARPDEQPLNEEQPFRPGNPYAVSKIAQDMLGLQYWLSYGLRVLRMRPFNHFGPGQSERFVLASFARQIAQVELGLAEPVVLTGDLSAERDFLDVRDVVRAYRLAALRATPGEAYNVASGVARRLGDVLDMLRAHASVPVEVRRDPGRLRPADIPRLVGDAGKLRAATGWTPRIALETSLTDTLDFWRATLNRVDGIGQLST
jgi:GDP-4-dehydro-6-deoxy-D-mannose reductase